VPKVGGSDRIGFISSGHDRKYVTTGNFRRNYIALDKRLNWVVVPRNGKKEATNNGNAGREAGSHKQRRTLTIVGSPARRKADHDKMMTKLEDKMDSHKEKLTAIFEAKIEDNSEKFEISRDTLVSRRKAHQECNIIIKDLGSRRPPYLRKPMERTRGNCESLKELVPSGMRMTHRAKVARRKEHALQRQGKADTAPRTGLELVKRATGISSGFRKMSSWNLWRSRSPPGRKIKDWVLWSDRPPPERKKILLAALA
jgi:hypothetical protein